MPSSDAQTFAPEAGERWRAFALRMGARLGLKPALSPAVPIPWQRKWLKEVTRTLRPKSSANVQSGSVGGVSGEWLRPGPATAKPAAILYLHGGAYCIGSAATHRAITAQLALVSSLPVFAADYRLAPEHPFPAALEDAVSAYRNLAEAGPVAIVGDSAGGGLALAVAMAARDGKLVAPAALVLLSPWADLSAAGLPDRAPNGEVILSAAWLNACARHYLGGADTKTPLASPLLGDLHGLPPTLIQSGTDEILHGQALRLQGALLDAGVAAACEIIPERWHTFQLHVGSLPSADAAVARAGNFIRRNIAA